MIAEVSTAVAGSRLLGSLDVVEEDTELADHKQPDSQEVCERRLLG